MTEPRVTLRTLQPPVLRVEQRAKRRHERLQGQLPERLLELLAIQLRIQLATQVEIQVAIQLPTLVSTQANTRLMTLLPVLPGELLRILLGTQARLRLGAGKQKGLPLSPTLASRRVCVFRSLVGVRPLVSAECRLKARPLLSVGVTLGPTAFIGVHLWLVLRDPSI